MQIKHNDIQINLDGYHIPDKSTRCISLNVLESITTDKQHYFTFQVVMPTAKVIMRTIFFDQKQLGLSDDACVRFPHQKNRQLQMVVKKYNSKFTEIRTMALAKLLSILGIAQHLSCSFSKVDLIFFKEYYIYFKEFTVGLQKYLKYREALSSKQLFKDMDTIIKEMHRYQIVHVNINENCFFYSQAKKKIIISNFDMSRPLIQKPSEDSKISQYPGKMTFQNEDFAKLKNELQKRKPQLVNFYKNDKFALKKTINKITPLVQKYKNASYLDTFTMKLQNVFQPKELPFVLRSCIIYATAYQNSFKDVQKSINNFQIKAGEQLMEIYIEVEKIYFGKGKFDDQLLVIKQIVKNKNDMIYQIKHIQCLISLGLIKQAQILLDAIKTPLLIKEELKAKIFYVSKHYQLCRKTLHKIVNCLDKNHSQSKNYLSVYNLLGLVYKEKGLYEKAYMYFTKLQQIHQKFSKQEAQLLTRYKQINKNNKLACENELNNYKNDEKNLLDIVKTKKQAFGYKNPILISNNYNLAIFYFRKGQYEKAEEFVRTCQKILKYNNNISKQIRIKIFQIKFILYKICNPLKKIKSSIANQYQQLSKLQYTNNIHWQSLRLIYENVLNQQSKKFELSNQFLIVEHRKRLIMSKSSITNSQQSLRDLEKARNLQLCTQKTSGLQILLLDIYSLYIKIQQKTHIQGFNIKINKMIDFTRQLNLLPLLAILFFIKGEFYHKKEDYSQSLKYFQKCYDTYKQIENLQPNQIIFKIIIQYLHQCLTQLYVKQKAYDKVRQIYKTIQNRNEHTTNMHLILAQINSQQKHYVEAIAQYKKYIKQFDKNHQKNEQKLKQIYENLADCYLYLDDIDSALDFFMKLEDMNKEEIFIKIAQIYTKKKNYHEALKYYSKIKNIQKYPHLCKKITMVCLNIEDKQYFKNYLITYLKYLISEQLIDPQIYKLIQSLPEINIQQRILCLKQQLKLLKKAKDQKSRKVVIQVHLRLANTYFELRSYSEAMQHYTQIIHQYKQDDQVVKNLFQCAIKTDCQNQNIYFQAIKLYLRQKGQNHPQTLKLIQTFGEYLFDQNRFYQSFIYLYKSLSQDHNDQVNKPKLILEKIHKSFQNKGQKTTKMMEKNFLMQMEWIAQYSKQLDQLYQLQKKIQKQRVPQNIPELKEYLSNVEEFILRYLMIDYEQNPLINKYKKLHIQVSEKLKGMQKV